MIPYEELVVALQTWRARQGLPVTQLSGSLTPPPAPTTRSAPPPMQGKPPAPPAPPPKAAAAAPPPLERPSHDSLDVEDAALLEDGTYEPEADNFTMKFGQHEVEHDVESTSVASPAGRPSDGAFGGLTDPNPLEGLHEHTEELPEPKGSIRPGNRNDDW